MAHYYQFNVIDEISTVILLFIIKIINKNIISSLVYYLKRCNVMDYVSN